MKIKTWFFGWLIVIQPKWGLFCTLVTFKCQFTYPIQCSRVSIIYVVLLPFIKSFCSTFLMALWINDRSSNLRPTTIDMILRSSSRYKKAKLTAESQPEVEDSESQPVDCVPDSQANPWVGVCQFCLNLHSGKQILKQVI